MSPRLTRLAAVALILLLGVLAFGSLLQKSVTVDELIYIGMGLYQWKTADLDSMIHPPLMGLLGALPLVAVGVDPPPPEVYPGDLARHDRDKVEQWKFSRALLFGSGRDADRLLTLARIPIVLLAMGLGVYVFTWSRMLYGDLAGLLALFLYCLSPNILANGRLVTHDLGLSFFVFAAAFHFWRHVRRPHALSLGLSGLFLGLGMLTKTAALFLWPVLLLYSIARVARGGGRGIHDERTALTPPGTPDRLRQPRSLILALVAVGATALLVLNAGYLFHGAFPPLGGPEARGVRALPVPLPEPYLYTLKDQGSVAANRVSFVAGRIYENGVWWGMAFAMLIKTPLPLLILGGVRIWMLASQRRLRDAEWLLILVCLVYFALFSYMRIFNVALRYLLPIYPMLHVLVSGVASPRPVRRPRWARVALGLLLAWYAAGTLRIHPHYLAYFNELIGGPGNGYRYLVDSNLDWGQDAKGLKRYMEAHGISRIALGYFGSADPSYYGIDYAYLPSVGLAPTGPDQRWWYEPQAEPATPVEPKEEVIAVSATLLASPGWMESRFRERYAALRRRSPVDQVGYSILIYRNP